MGTKRELRRKLSQVPKEELTELKSWEKITKVVKNLSY